jgi:methylphosphotriester-DNA--protein-cysteine methyltransferase
MKKRSLLIMLLSATLTCSSALYAATSGVVKGNATSKVYHAPACVHYSGKGSTVEFNSAAEAKKAGYKGCKQCIKSDDAKKK